MMICDGVATRIASLYLPFSTKAFLAAEMNLFSRAVEDQSLAYLTHSDHSSCKSLKGQVDQLQGSGVLR